MGGNIVKNVIITGGASGIGLATAKKLSKDNRSSISGRWWIYFKID